MVHQLHTQLLNKIVNKFTDSFDSTDLCEFECLGTICESLMKFEKFEMMKYVS